MPGGRSFREDPGSLYLCGKAGGILPLRLHMLTTLHVHQDAMRSCHAHRASFCCLVSGWRITASGRTVSWTGCAPERNNARPLASVHLPAVIPETGVGCCPFHQAGCRQRLHDRFVGTLLIGARIPHNLLERAFQLMQVLWDVRHVSLDVPQGLIRLVERRNDLAP
jgi:hypothetical protein